MAIDTFLDMARLPNSTIKYNGAENITGADIVAAAPRRGGSHMIGTTIMGLDRKTAVVDTDCKVYGTDNLFIVDAGVHADLPTGNTQAIVGVVAEHAVQKIIALSGGNGTGYRRSTPSRVRESVASPVRREPQEPSGFASDSGP
ncbi:hypothetical protein CC80DRAFT_552238 [Byssothecium circinans]|uniref:Glucose-methanol-choline oxidoreductase C-terminal domain-containing protein n=1 Tax=Byssothecium circinans TaxID=147558 RepID=A0A6A5TU30_9PLEO|nr:hypothetical protein CC80DRAFT_552238 [Byssothecium circinans]